jgi:hypothetical protein
MEIKRVGSHASVKGSAELFGLVGILADGTL